MATVHILINKYLCAHRSCQFSCLWFVNLGYVKRNSGMHCPLGILLYHCCGPLPRSGNEVMSLHVRPDSQNWYFANRHWFRHTSYKPPAIVLMAPWILLVAKYLEWHSWRQGPLSRIFGHLMLRLRKPTV